MTNFEILFLQKQIQSQIAENAIYITFDRRKRYIRESYFVFSLQFFIDESDW